MVAWNVRLSAHLTAARFIERIKTESERRQPRESTEMRALNVIYIVLKCRAERHDKFRQHRRHHAIVPPKPIYTEARRAYL